MKKFVSFCVAVAFAASTVPAMAQCASCGGAPAFSQPVASSYVPQAAYAAPVYSAPVQSTPVYSAPIQSAPVYSAPIQSAPVYSAPVQSSVVSSPIVSSPVVSSPCGGCGGCSGGIVQGGIVSGGIVESGVISSGISQSSLPAGLPAGSQIISWEGGQEIQGTIVSDVLLEGGDEAASTESTVDVVEPPVAEKEDAPGPDSGEEEETEGET